MTERVLTVMERIVLFALYERRDPETGLPAETRELLRRQGTFAVEVTPRSPASPRLARAAVHDVYVSELTINNLERIGLLQGFAVTGEAGRPPRPRWHLTAAGEYEIAPYVEAGWPEGVEA